MKRWALISSGATLGVVGIAGGLIGGLALAGNFESEPDRIVGIVTECEIGEWTFSRTEGRKYQEHEGTGSECTEASDRRKVLTIRESGGGTYEVTVSYTQRVSLGQAWPP